MNNEKTSMIRQEVIDMVDDGPITWEQYKEFPMNSYEKYYLLEFLDDDCFIKVCNIYLNNLTQRKFPTTYEEAVITKLFPEIVNRFKKDK